MDIQSLKQRLIVAETLMKKLYNRNKELEEFHRGKGDLTIKTTSIEPSSDRSVTIDIL